MQIAEIDATDETAPYAAKTYRWDPSEPVATRPLALTLWTREGTARETLYYAHDLRKNVVSLFDAKGLRRASYQYDPYGNITSMEGDMAEENPFRFSSEHHDEDLGLVYYNYRHYNPTDGRRTSRDPIAEEGGWNLYGFVNNRPIDVMDILGMYGKDIHFYFNYYVALYLCLDRFSGFVCEGQRMTSAFTIAFSAQFVDDYEKTEPFSLSGDAGATVRHKFHFPDVNDKTIRDHKEVRNTLQKQVDDLAFGLYLHIYADTYAHEGYGDVWGHLNGGGDVDIPWQHQERDRAMVKAVYNRMREYAIRLGVKCDWEHKSAEELLKRIESTLFRKEDDEKKRIEYWKKLIKKDFNTNVDYSKNIKGGYVDAFDKIQQRVPNWVEKEIEYKKIQRQPCMP